MAEDHVANAEKARDVLIRQRRALVEILSRGYNGSEAEGNVELLVKFQAAIYVSGVAEFEDPCARMRHRTGVRNRSTSPGETIERHRRACHNSRVALGRPRCDRMSRPKRLRDGGAGAEILGRRGSEMTPRGAEASACGSPSGEGDDFCVIWEHILFSEA
jgi:hypothetical protein